MPTHQAAVLILSEVKGLRQPDSRLDALLTSSELNRREVRMFASDIERLTNAPIPDVSPAIEPLSAILAKRERWEPTVERDEDGRISRVIADEL